MVSVDLIKQLRQETSAGLADCKNALQETNSNLDEAKTLLRKKGLSDLGKRQSKSTLEGHIGHYIHAGGKIAVLVEVGCETDFVAKNEQFQNFVHDLAMHIAAANPYWLDRDNVPQEAIIKEKEIASQGTDGKPDHVVEKIVQGRLGKFYKQVCLLEQPYVKDQNMTIEELLGEQAIKLGERLVVKRFVRYAVGEE